MKLVAFHSIFLRLKTCVAILSVVIASSAIAVPSNPPIANCAGDECQATNEGGFDLSQYNIPFNYSWPAPPNTSSSVTVTPGSIASNNVSGRSITLGPGNYGVIQVATSDQEFILQDGAVVEAFNITPAATRIKIRGATPRAGIIRSVTSPQYGGPQDIMFDGVHFEHTPSMTGTIGVSFHGTRVALINSSGLVGGYIPASFNYAEGALDQFICAGNRFVSDYSVAKSGTGAQSMGRIVDGRRVIFVGNWMEKVDTGAGMRFHGDRFGSEDLFIADNIFINRGQGGGGFVGVLFSLNPGGSGGSPAGHDRVTFFDNELYHNNSSNAFLHDTHPTIRATNVTFTNNRAFAPNSGFPNSEATWTISNNSTQGYRTPPSSTSKVGF